MPLPVVQVEKRGRGRKPKLSEAEMAAETRFREELIICVRRQPALYDKTAKEFKDDGFKDSEWRKIGLELNKSASECKTAWTDLRDRFRKHWKSLEKPSGSGADPPKPFQFYEDLLWLTSHVQMRRTKTSVGPYQESEEEGEDAGDEDEEATPILVDVDLTDDKFEVFIASDSETETPAKRTRSASKVSTSERNSPPNTCFNSIRKVRRELWQADRQISPDKARQKASPKPSSSGTKNLKTTPAAATSVPIRKAQKAPEKTEASDKADKTKTPVKSPVASLSPHLPILSPTKRQNEQVKTAKEHKKAADNLLMGTMKMVATSVQQIAEARRQSLEAADGGVGADSNSLEDCLGKRLAANLKKIKNKQALREWRRKATEFIDDLEDFCDAE